MSAIVQDKYMTIKGGNRDIVQKFLFTFKKDRPNLRAIKKIK